MKAFFLFLGLSFAQITPDSHHNTINQLINESYSVLSECPEGFESSEGSEFICAEAGQSFDLFKLVESMAMDELKDYEVDTPWTKGEQYYYKIYRTKDLKYLFGMLYLPKEQTGRESDYLVFNVHRVKS
jgi:hypothetical protein